MIECGALPDEQCPDVYFTAGYGSAAALLRAGQWESVRHDDRIAVPYVVNQIDDGRWDAVSPFGFSGVYVAPHCSTDDLIDFWAKLRDWWRGRGVVAMFFRFSPLDQASTDALRALDGISLKQRNETITLKLDKGAARLWEELKAPCRNKIRKAQRAGLTAGLRPAKASDLGADSPFRTLYAQTMDRVGAGDGYVFSDAYYAALVRGLGDRLMIAQVWQPDGQVIAASLVMVHRERVHYHLTGSDKTAGLGSAVNLLIWTIVQWAIEHGKTLVHLGGGVRPGDPLLAFKSSFGGQKTPVWHGSAVIDQPAYDQLVHARAVVLGMSAMDLRERDYFPAYRYGAGLI